MIPWKVLTKDIKEKDMLEYGEFREAKDNPGLIAGFVVSKQTGKSYSIQIQMDTNTLGTNTKIRAFCNCDDFKFRWAYVLHKFDALIAPQNFILLPPKITNPNMTPGCCKHIKVFLELKYHDNLRKLSLNKGEI